MEYREIVAVTGIGGLFQLLNTKSDGAIVCNLSDKSTKFIPARVHNVTPIESIEIYTIEDNVRLHMVFKAMQDLEAQHPLVSPKADNQSIKNYFKAVFPILDEERVYVSDMKKILKWYELLKANDLLHFEEVKQESESVENTNETATQSAEAQSNEEKPVKKARAKKAAQSSDDAEEKPAKKTSAKKKKTEE